jgi:hypothetical protein
MAACIGVSAADMATCRDGFLACRHYTQHVITNLTIVFTSLSDTSNQTHTEEFSKWHRLEKDLYLDKGERSAWLYISYSNSSDLNPNSLVVTDIVTHKAPRDYDSWESRPCGIWVRRAKYIGVSMRVVTDVDVLFGTDAVDPRPQWNLDSSPLQLDGQPDVPIPRLTVQHRFASSGEHPEYPRSRPVLRFNPDDTFKILQISDTHMVTGVGECKDAIDRYGRLLPVSEADPMTIKFIHRTLAIEKPDLVVLTGDQLHHNIPDSQSALLKLFAPFVEQCVSFAAVFGNHDDEGVRALSRKFFSFPISPFLTSWTL